MTTSWQVFEGGPPDQDSIDDALDKASSLPDDGDGQHILSPFEFYEKALPDITAQDWARAKAKQVKIRKLLGSTARLNRENLLWHIKNPGKSRYRGARNTHPNVYQDDKGRRVIVDGHHRLAALHLLGVRKEQVWLLKKDDLPST